ncbi:hypothetical protein B0H63DRAFT_51958 [Podospora didyma]|uniref:Uncharacterized protein n=1 Tax=Podospora didyma TaxID=330526 RepID=A0AAE0P7C7_9PEZI|nr:hypothetical protein B0H63DRAFT_51958 [Podospora didyma]
MAARGRENSPSSSSLQTTTASQPATTMTITTTGPATSTRSQQVCRSSPAPTDGGCPAINGTIYQPKNAIGQDIILAELGQPQSFKQLCATNHPSGSGSGPNTHLFDIMKPYLPSLEECITARAYYNLQLNVNERILGKTNIGEFGLCRSVSIVKRERDYCYLKNGTGTNDAFGVPLDFASAVLLDV